jgi:mono/diheme cytochrome c family protein
MLPFTKSRRRAGIGSANRLAPLCAFVACALASGVAGAQARGYMLYNQYCIECHTAQVHWRDGRLASDWKSLNVQVRRWQAVANLNWSEEDILNVTRYLNTRYYDFWPPTEVTVTPVMAPQAQRRSSTASR